MNIQDVLKEKTIIICEQSYKEAFLMQMQADHLFGHLKFYTKKEFLQEYLFSYDEEAIYYLVKKYHYKIDIAKMYLNNLYYIEDIEYQEPKLVFLANLKKELQEKGLLFYNPLFKNFIQDYQIIVYGYSYLENYERIIFDNLHAQYLDDFSLNKLESVYEFTTLKEEVNYVARQIADLIRQGVSIQNIKLMNVSEEYYNELRKVFHFFKIPLKLPTSNNLLSNALARQFLENPNAIKNQNNDIANKVITIFNKYSFIKEEDILKEFLTYEFKNTPVSNDNLLQYVEIINLDDYVSKDTYVFLMNFNSSSIPQTLKDEDYLTDKIKHYLNIDDTITKNKKIKEYTIKKLQSINKLTISYKLNDTHREYFPSSLVGTLNLQIKKITLDILTSYSKTYDALNLAKLEDDYRLYGTINEDYIVYKNNLTIPYNTYDNQFKGIDKDDLQAYLHHKLVLSYSSLNTYNKCAFRYYIANILKLDKYEETFEALIGSLFHYLLAMNTYNLDIDREINNYLKQNNLTLSLKERFYLRKLKEDIAFVLETIKEQNNLIGLKETLCEQNVVIDKSTDMHVEFTGFIDKILYEKEDDNTLVAIIDYKTGHVNTNLNYLTYGLNLQLPIYLYLVKKSQLFSHPQFVGFYYEFILKPNLVRDINKSYLESKKESLKLQGYSIKNESILRKFDPNYQNSSLIYGLKVNKDGNFSKNAKVLDESEMEQVISLVEKNIDTNIAKIKEGNFPINPKKIGYDKDLGCEYCHFKDLCFKKEKDYLILEEINSLNFLGGEE